jgi:hypothetical protein
MARAWLELGAESVLWVNPYPCRLPRLSDLKRTRGLESQNTQLDPRISILDVPAIPIEPLPGGAWLNRTLLWRDAWDKLADFADKSENTVIGIGRPGALALMALRQLPHKAGFFDAMDNFPQFHHGLSRRSMKYYEDAVAAEVDMVVASSCYLAEKFVNRGLFVKKTLNAYDMASLPPWRPTLKRELVLGFVGCFGRWFDWPLVAKLAEQLPQARFELVGPKYVVPPNRLPSNIRFFPPCKQSEAWKHLSRFSAGLIPFIRNELTDAFDPVKYYEYRAAGLPVLCTAFGEMKFRTEKEHVYFLDRAGDMTPVVHKAVEHRDDEASVAVFRSENDWKERLIASSPFASILFASEKNMHKKAA